MTPKQEGTNAERSDLAVPPSEFEHGCTECSTATDRRVKSIGVWGYDRLRNVLSRIRN